MELNKIAASILLAGLIAMVAATITNFIYPRYGAHHGHEEKRGYQIEVAEDAPADGAKKEAAAPIDVAALMAAATVEAGQNVAKKCTACHSFEKGGANKVGPNLYGVLGGPLAHAKDFNYSQALKDASGKIPGWDYENLFAYLANPKAYIPGNKMAFAGIKNPKDIADLIAYMRSQSDTQYPLPQPK